MIQPFFNGWEEEEGEKMYSLWPHELEDIILRKILLLRLHGSMTVNHSTAQ